MGAHLQSADEVLLNRRRFFLWCCDQPGRKPTASNWDVWRRGEAPRAYSSWHIRRELFGSWRAYVDSTENELRWVLSKRGRTQGAGRSDQGAVPSSPQ